MLPGMVSVIAGLTGAAASQNIAYASTASGGGAQNFSFASQPIGTAAADRYVVVAISNYASLDIPVVSSVSVGGTACTKAVDASRYAPGVRNMTMWITNSAVASGNTATIEVNTTDTNTGIVIAVWAVYGIASPTANTTASTTVNTTTPTHSLGIAFPTGGVLIAASVNSNSSGANMTWNGATEDLDGAFGSIKFAGASTNSGNGIVKVYGSSASSGTFIAATWL